MTLKKKLLMCGLLGTTCLALYKLSKKREKEREKQRIEQSQHVYNIFTAPNNTQVGGHSYAAWGAAAAAAGADGAYAFHHHQQQQTQQSHPKPVSAALETTPELSGDTLWADLRDWKVIARLLAATVADQYLYPFYDWPKIQHIAQQIANSGTLVEIAESWEMPPFLAQDLVKLALFDVMFLLDDSASMNSEHGARIEGLRQIVKRAADAAGRLDPDGMEVAWMNADLSAHDSKIRSAKDADRVVKQCRFDGRATPLGYALERKLLGPHLLLPLSRGYLKKPVLVIVITDGRPTGSSEKGEKIVQVIKESKERLRGSQYGEDALSVTIAAVGNDAEAQAWLDTIDSNSIIGDLVDVVSDIHQEGHQIKKTTGVDLTPDLHCLKLLLGGIDSGYDASDEASNGKYDRRQREKDFKNAAFADAKRRLIEERDAAMSGGGAASPYGYSQPQFQGVYPRQTLPPPYADHTRGTPNVPVIASEYDTGIQCAAPQSNVDLRTSAGYHPSVGGFAMPLPQPQPSVDAYGESTPQGGGYGAPPPPQSIYPEQQGSNNRFPTAFPS